MKDLFGFQESLNLLFALARAKPPRSVFGLEGLPPSEIWAALPSHQALGRRFCQKAVPREFEKVGKDRRGIAVYLRK
jgi:hypothetical protein